MKLLPDPNHAPVLHAGDPQYARRHVYLDGGNGAPVILPYVVATSHVGKLTSATNVRSPDGCPRAFTSAASGTFQYPHPAKKILIVLC